MPDTDVPTYSMAERDRRWERARRLMAREGLDALLVFGEHEDAGPAPVSYDTWFTNGRPGTTVIFARDREPISLFPMELFMMDHLESSGRGDAMWIPPENVRMTRDSRAVVGTITELGLTSGTIGVVGLEPYPPWYPEGIVPHGLWNNVLAQLPEAEFRPAAPAFLQMIMAMSREEIAVVRHAAGIGDEMVRAMVDTARPGVPESEVYAAAMSAAHTRGTIVPGMHFWSGPEPLASGPPPWAYRPQAPRVLRDHDIISAEVFSHFGGRHTQHQVTIALGEVPEDLARAADIARAAYDAGLRALRPGRTFGEVVEEMREPAAAAGGWVFGPAVHGLNPMIGLSGFPGDIGRRPGAEAYPSVPDKATMLAGMRLEPGMSFAFEPNYAIGRHLAHIGGTVIVGEDEPVELNPYTARILRPGSPHTPRD
ncbi:MULTISPECIES: M24 family metallopeptidase [unclassified Streptomyces]|uniref:M24 family metallopeptidase n=1 Tax=unclassified Streptomyces TaxID=2593676 RepID=UPI000BF67B6C|nr:M24 family metallopeptidase [Streptomyces sp. Ru87]PGH52120.1 Xaa-Pro aminopeptidase [Streptomyces sp. Ru87]